MTLIDIFMAIPFIALGIAMFAMVYLTILLACGENHVYAIIYVVGIIWFVCSMYYFFK